MVRFDRFPDPHELPLHFREYEASCRTESSAKYNFVSGSSAALNVLLFFFCGSVLLFFPHPDSPGWGSSTFCSARHRRSSPVSLFQNLFISLSLCFFLYFWNYSVTELPEHLKSGGIPSFSGCVHDTNTACLSAMQLLYYFWIFSPATDSFLCFPDTERYFTQDIKCTYRICIVSYSVSYIHTPHFSV